ncbi:hypothetical protein PAMP_019839 [Pampus punctatissimus]
MGQMMTKIPVITAMRASHNQFCSTWGNYHFKTFDGDFFQLPSTCNYIFASQCKGSYENFNIELQRQEINGTTSIKKVTMRLEAVVVELSKSSIKVDDKIVTIPFSQFGISIERSVTYINIKATLGLVIMWNEEDSLWVELDAKFKNQTCGLCGDFNGIQFYDEFIQKETGDFITAENLGEVWKANGPTENCEDISPPATQTCANQGQWSCKDKDCPGICSILGGSHISTYDDKTYTFHGECSYVLSKESNGTFSVLGDLIKCKNSDKSTCLAAVTLLLPKYMMIVVEANGQVFVNKLISQLPRFMDDITVFSPSTFYIVIHTSYGLHLDIQLTPIMQVYIKASVSNKAKLSGLCGDFNDVGADDFRTTNGLIEGTAVTFANTWKTKTICPDVINILGDPCTLSVSKEKYANNWCSLLSDTKAIFAQCHSEINPQDYQAVNTQCISGCVCPDGLLSDGKGGCTEEEHCPCTYSGKFYKTGQTVPVGCNTCTCKSRKWECTKHECDGICTIYGEGHYTTFDERKFFFTGDCEYVFTQDYCGDDVNGTFRVLTEHVSCGTTESICSTAIKLYLGNNEIVLSEENIRVIKQSNGTDIPYQVHTIGIYLVIEANNGLVLIWNKKTIVMIQLSSTFKGKVCGLCGNYDGNTKNDFTTRNKEVVVEALDVTLHYNPSNNHRKTNHHNRNHRKNNHTNYSSTKTHHCNYHCRTDRKNNHRKAYYPSNNNRKANSLSNHCRTDRNNNLRKVYYPSNNNRKANSPSNQCRTDRNNNHRKAYYPSNNNRKANSPSNHCRTDRNNNHKKAYYPSNNRKANSPSNYCRTNRNYNHRKAYYPSNNNRKANSPSNHCRTDRNNNHRKVYYPSNNRKANSPSNHCRTDRKNNHRKAYYPSNNRKAKSPSNHCRTDRNNNHRKAYYPSNNNRKANTPSNYCRTECNNNHRKAYYPSNNNRKTNHHNHNHRKNNHTNYSSTKIHHCNYRKGHNNHYN